LHKSQKTDGVSRYQSDEKASCNKSQAVREKRGEEKEREKKERKEEVGGGRKKENEGKGERDGECDGVLLVLLRDCKLE
jgi:hypothetical protein